MTGFTVAAAIGLALGFLFGVGCAAAVLYTIFLAGYRRALQDEQQGGLSSRYREEKRRLQSRKTGQAASPSDATVRSKW